MMWHVVHLIWRIVRLLLIVPVVCMLIFVAWLLSTKEGTQFIASEASNRLSQLQLEGVDGYLLGDLTVESIQWRQLSVAVSAQNVSANWSPLCLLEKSICLDTLKADQLIVDLLPSTEESTDDEGLPSIVMPIAIFADWTDIQTFQLIISGQTHTITGLQFSGRWVDSILALPQVSASYEGLNLSVEGEMDFSVPWDTEFKGGVSYPLPGHISKRPLNFDFELQGTQLAFDIKGDLSGDWPAKLSSTISFDDPRLPLNLTFESPTSWQIPLGIEPAEASTTQVDIKQFVADIRLRDLSFQVDSLLTTEYWREFGLSLEGQWKDERLTLEQLQLDSTDGQLRLQGELENTPKLPFDLTLSTQQLAVHKAMLPGSSTPKSLLPYPAIFDSQWRITGHAGEDNLAIAFNLQQLNGSINQLPVSAQAVFSYDRVNWQVSELVVSSGDNQLSASGALNAGADHFQNIEMHFMLPDPHQWLPDIKGSLAGRVSVNGHLDRLDLHGQLTSEMLEYGDISIAAVEAVFDIAQSAKEESYLTLSVENLDVAGVQVESTDWELKGDWNGSSVQGDIVVHNMGHASLNCDLLWDVALQEAQASSPLKGYIESDCSAFSWDSTVFPYALFTPHNTRTISINYSIDDTRLVIKPFCLADEGIEVCNHQDALWSPEDGYSLWLNTQQLPVKQLLARWNREADASNRIENLELQGVLNGFAKISQPPGSTISAELGVDLPLLDITLGSVTPSYDGNSKYHLKEEQAAPLHLVFEPLSLSSTLSDEDITLNGAFTSPQLGRVDSQLTVTDIAKQRLLGGDITLSQLDLSFLQDALPSVEHIAGILSGQLNLSGTTKKPMLMGQFSFSEGALKSDYLPETLDEVSIDGTFNQQQLNYQGVFRSAGGQANLDGRLNWQHQWELNTSLRSEAFDITPRAGVSLTIKPNISLLLKEGFADISGTFEIPHARIKIDELPEGTKSVSADARVIGDERYASDTQWDYQANIKLILGRDVYFRGFGVNTYLTGQLLLQQKPGKVLGGKGEINTDDGFYTIFGQRLTVKEGRFVFNGPLERPYLQLDAMRSISGSSVKVGVKVTGPANEPDVTFYSQPAMNETSVIHYLLTGRAPDSNANNADLLNNMMLSAGIFGSAELTEKWANKVGVTDLQISTQSDDEGTSLEVSGYLSPDIYLKYGASLYDEAKTVAMRYRLRPNLFLEAAGGFNSSLDIIYSFEHE